MDVFKNRKLFRKSLLLVFFGAFLVSITSLYLLLDQKKPHKNLRDSFQRPIDLTLTEPACGNIDLISYLTYNDVSDEKIKNNKVGLYIYAENKDYMELAQKLVNSNGGDWGYVLLPYNVKDTDHSKWRDVFERLRNKHLIPIVQLWDVDPEYYEDQTEDAAEFLNSFMWPIKERYISVYNEPNDDKFWKEKADPAEYARVLNHTIDTFRKENPSFFILNGALNISAGSGDGYIDAFDFMRAMDKEVPGIFNKLDGWASHSYPQPNFSGSPHAGGRNSIRAYEEELDFLKNEFGVYKDLPVFITETGRAHAEGLNYNASFYSADRVAEFFRVAYREYWLLDDRVWAVTPFTILYKPPFDHFSWINTDSVPYEQYEVVKSIKKVSGTPRFLVEKKVKMRKCE